MDAIFVILSYILGIVTDYWIIFFILIITGVIIASWKKDMKTILRRVAIALAGCVLIPAILTIILALLYFI